MHFGISFVVRFKGFKGSLYANQKHCIYWAIQAPECCQNSYEYEGLHSSSILSQIRVPYVYIYISTYEFPSTLRLLLSPPIPNCNMLQHISHLRIQVTGDPTNMEPHKKKSHQFFVGKSKFALWSARPWASATPIARPTAWQRCISNVQWSSLWDTLVLTTPPMGPFFWVYTRSTLGFTNGS